MDRVFNFDVFEENWPTAELVVGEKELNFNHLKIDSRALKSGDGFVACVGHKLDGRQFIDSAIEQGAKLILAEAAGFDRDKVSHISEQSVTLVLVEALNEHLSDIAALLYGNPSENILTIGVTGTNGKSSCVQMLAQALHLIDGCCWTMGTLGCGPFGAQIENENTTADPITIQRELNKAVSYGCANTAMEVSSHGLVQNRVASVKFDFAVFTNLTHEHLDYHKTMDAYGEAKRQLFLGESLKWAIINVDDKFGRKLKKDSAITANKIFLSLKEPTEGADLRQWIWVEDIRLTLKGIRANVFTPWGQGKIKVPLIGRFNLNNILSVVAVLGVKLQNADEVFKIVNQLTSVAGRMQLIREDDKPLIIVDYAHTPDALEQALMATREHCNGKIVTVFGCGGDRDSAKRPLMARVAEKYSNAVIFTDDNPRTETPETIIDDMRAGLKNPDKVTYVSDRKQAIEQAVASVSSLDVVVIAGKGHEGYQIIGTTKHKLSDVTLAKDVLTGGRND